MFLALYPGEMADTFVVVKDRVHELLRQCTRGSVLRPVAGGKAIRYDFRPENLSNEYFSLAAYHALQGFSVDETSLTRWRVQDCEKAGVALTAGYFDVTRLDHRCAGDLRLQIPGRGPRMVAAELLSFGTGALRPAGYFAANAWEFAEYGRLGTPFEKVYTRIGALCCGGGSSQFGTEKEVYCSTNLVYGDALGELEQLWERRADIDFLQQVAQNLRCLSQWPRFPVVAHAPLNYEAVFKLHLRAQAVWDKPPANARALLRRLDYLLDHLVIDSNPATAFTPPPRRTNRSGYDGWLTDTGSALN